MARTISSSISGPINLANPAQDSPLVITRKGAVISGPGVDGIDGTAAAAWTITNSGTVSSEGGIGISLAGAGTVINGLVRLDNALISGSVAGIEIQGAGTVTNVGAVSSSYGFGVELLSGGSVTNSGAASVISGGYSGVKVAGAAGTVTNAGKITGGAFDGVNLSSGGVVKNTGTASAILGGTYGVYVSGGVGTVTNEGTIAGANNLWFGSGVDMASGGKVTNSGKASLISGVDSGVKISGSAGTVTNNGTITGANSVWLDAGGVVKNFGTASVISGPFSGVWIDGGVGTVTNEGKITGTAPEYSMGVDLGQGGKVTNSGKRQSSRADSTASSCMPHPAR
jgi:hypothetical protein